MPKLTIDTKATLQSPIEIEIDGKKFKVKSLNRELLKKLEETDERVRQGNISAAYERLELLLGKDNRINALAPAHIGKITDFIITNLFAPETEEKNG